MGFRKFIEKVDSRKAFELVVGTLGIYISFLFSGIKYEKIVSNQYINPETLDVQKFTITAGFMAVERCINWICGLVYQHLTLEKSKRVEIPRKNSVITAGLIYLSSVTTTQSMYYVSYPLVIMSKSCSLLSVILVGVFCSRVRSKQLKLESSKIIIVTIVTIGIILFRLFDPSANFKDNKQTQMFGILLIILSLFADGFIPDFQAQIKQKFKPQPIEMLIKFNKWTAIWGLFHIIITNQLLNFIKFCLNYHQFVVDLVFLSLATFVGQIFVYRMIKEFKQHIVPFVITTRKIVTVGLSIVYFSHPTSPIQLTSIFAVLLTTFYEFGMSIRKSQNKQTVNNFEQIQQKIAIEENKMSQQSQKQSLIQEQKYRMGVQKQTSLKKESLIKKRHQIHQLGSGQNIK